MELDRVRITTPVAWKQIKAFKKRHEVEPNQALENEGDVWDDDDE